MEETLYLLAIAGMEASIIEGGKAAEDAGMRLRHWQLKTSSYDIRAAVQPFVCNGIQ